MRRVLESLSRVAGAFGRARRDADLQDELRIHADLARESGRPAIGTAQAMEALRDQRSLPWVENVARDLRHGVRALRRAPAFTAAAVLTLALAIGVSTAMFAVMNAVLFRPLPYPDADRLAMIWTDNRAQGVSQARTTFADVDAWRQRSRTFSDIAFFDPASLIVTLHSGPEHVSAAYVSPNLFGLVGAGLVRGRAFTEEDAAGRQPVALVSDGFWRTHFAGAPDAAGAGFDLDGRRVTIGGVVTPTDFPEADVWLPYTATADWDAQRERHGAGPWFAIGRLAPGATIEMAQAELSASVQPIGRYLVGAQSRLALWLLAGAVIAVLLLAAANVAGLTVTRNAGRSREIAVRTALGASGLRIAGALLAETVSLAAMAGGLALPVAATALRLVRVSAADSLPRLRDAHLEPRVFAAAAAICLGTAVLVGLIPALAAVRGGVRPDTLVVREIAGSRGTRRLRRGFVSGEIALAVVLLAAAGLFARSLWAAERVALGFDPDGVLAVALSDPAGRSAGARISSYTAALDAVAHVPRVDESGIVGDFIVGGGSVQDVRTDESSEPRPVLLRRDEASGGMFAAVGARLIRGRVFSDRDTAASPRVAIVNETMARILWTGDPIGRRFTIGGAAAPWFTVVGVVADMRREGPEVTPSAQMFEPLAQNPSRLETLIVRTAAASPMTLAPAIRAAVRRADPTLAVYGITTLDARFGEFLARRRLLTSLLAAFSLYAVLLAAVGIYGLVHYSVAMRRREIAIRMAIGARPAQIVSLVLHEAAALSLAGLIVGTMGALALGRIGASLLFGVRAGDPMTFAAAVALLAAAAIAASLVPALRATAIDPNAALRQD